jgi:hypothetical protein
VDANQIRTISSLNHFITSRSIARFEQTGLSRRCALANQSWLFDGEKGVTMADREKRTASCIAKHALQGQNIRFGPSLTRVPAVLVHASSMDLLPRRKVQSLANG